MAIPAIRTEWSEELLFDLLRVARSGDDATQEEVDAAVRAALEHEGTVVPIGKSGRTIWLKPGLKERLGIC